MIRTDIQVLGSNRFMCNTNTKVALLSWTCVLSPTLQSVSELWIWDVFRNVSGHLPEKWRHFVFSKAFFCFRVSENTFK